MIINNLKLKYQITQLWRFDFFDFFTLLTALNFRDSSGIWFCISGEENIDSKYIHAICTLINKSIISFRV